MLTDTHTCSLVHTSTKNDHSLSTQGCPIGPDFRWSKISARFARVGQGNLAQSGNPAPEPDGDPACPGIWERAAMVRSFRNNGPLTSRCSIDRSHRGGGGGRREEGGEREKANSDIDRKLKTAHLSHKIRKAGPGFFFYLSDFQGFHG